MEIIIRPKNKWWKLDFNEVWEFRDLFYFLTWRDLKVKYKQTFVGVAWAIFQPLVTMIIFTIFFGRLAEIPSDGIPYPIFVYTGLVFWTLFNTGLTNASNSFINNEKIVTKIYFPRFILPASAVITNVIDFFVASIFLGLLMLYYQYIPTFAALLLVPILLLMTILSSFGIGIFFASINVKYRDVRFVLPFFLQLLLFLTPVIYPVSITPEKYQWLLGLNPMSGVIDTARVVILGTGDINFGLLSVSLLMMITYLIFGFVYFRRVERYFADVI